MPAVMPAREQTPAVALIDMDQFIEGWKHRIFPVEVTKDTEELRFRRMQPKAIRTMSAYAVRALVTIRGVEEKRPDYSVIRYELDGSVHGAEEADIERSMNLNNEGYVFAQHQTPRGPLRRPRVKRSTIGYLMHADSSLEEMQDWLSARRSLRS